MKGECREKRLTARQLVPFLVSRSVADYQFPVTKVLVALNARGIRSVYCVESLRWLRVEAREYVATRVKKGKGETMCNRINKEKRGRTMKLAKNYYDTSASNVG